MTENYQNDYELVAAVGRRDMASLGELVRRHQDKVLALAFRLLGRWDLAEDVTQNAFLNVYHAATEYQPRARFTTWLYRIVVNLCHDVRRKEKQLEPLSVVPDLPAAPSEDPIEVQERAKWVHKIVSELPERQRTVLILHRYHQLSHSEIAETTGWSASAVESLLSRAYSHLRRQVEKNQSI